LVAPGRFTEVVGLTVIRSTSFQPGDSETVSLNGTTAGGVSVNFNSSHVQITAYRNANVTLIIAAGASATPGNFTLQVQGVSGQVTQSASFNVRVVQKLVFMLNGAFNPMGLAVTTGTTVYWQNLDAQNGPSCFPGGPIYGPHNVVFTTLTGANSPSMNTYAVYSYTFTTAGSFFYYSSLDTDHLMNGTITVTG